MKKIFTVLAFVMFYYVSYSQQDPQFSQNMFNKLFVNPAAAGSSDAICGSLLYRDQWDKFDGAPKTGVLNLDAAIDEIHGGAGLSLLSDKIGFENTIGANISYAFRFNVGSSEKFAIGLNAGIIQKTIDGQFNPPDKTVTDPLIPQGSVSGSAFDLGAGIYYNSENLYLGASSTHLIESKINLGGTIKYDLLRHYYFMGGYSLDLSPSISLKPSVFVKSDSKETQADFNLNLHINNRFWVGGSYRIQDAIVVMAGLNITEDLRLGYSFDITTSQIKTYSNGTHEIMLGYCYKVKKKAIPMLRNVRFL